MTGSEPEIKNMYHVKELMLNDPVQPVAIVYNERCASCMPEEGTRFIAFVISFEIVLYLRVIWITATVCADIVIKFLNNTHIFMVMMLIFVLFGDQLFKLIIEN